jgi:5-methylcytosine-specific restriction endonuclease McrA
MECILCNYKTENRKSFSNHTRFGCPSETKFLGLNCKECGKELIKKWQTGKQAVLFCNNKCYGNWRSKNIRGENSSNYKHGKRSENLLFRASREYKEWRKVVFSRDKYTCVICGDRKGGNLEADHIKDFALYPELRLNINNGRTLCKSCHKKNRQLWIQKIKHKKEKLSFEHGVLALTEM